MRLYRCVLAMTAYPVAPWQREIMGRGLPALAGLPEDFGNKVHDLSPSPIRQIEREGKQKAAAHAFAVAERTFATRSACATMGASTQPMEQLKWQTSSRTAELPRQSLWLFLIGSPALKANPSIRRPHGPPASPRQNQSGFSTHMPNALRQRQGAGANRTRRSISRALVDGFGEFVRGAEHFRVATAKYEVGIGTSAVDDVIWTGAWFMGQPKALQTKLISVHACSGPLAAFWYRVNRGAGIQKALPVLGAPSGARALGDWGSWGSSLADVALDMGGFCAPVGLRFVRGRMSGRSTPAGHGRAAGQ